MTRFLTAAVMELRESLQAALATRREIADKLARIEERVAFAERIAWLEDAMDEAEGDISTE